MPSQKITCRIGYGAGLQSHRAVAKARIYELQAPGVSPTPPSDPTKYDAWANEFAEAVLRFHEDHDANVAKDDQELQYWDDYFGSSWESRTPETDARTSTQLKEREGGCDEKEDDVAVGRLMEDLIKGGDTAEEKLKNQQKGHVEEGVESEEVEAREIIGSEETEEQAVVEDEGYDGGDEDQEEEGDQE